MRKWNLAVLVTAALLTAARASGSQQDSRTEPKPADEPISLIDKGRTQIGGAVVAGSTLTPQASIGYRPSLELVAHWGKIVSEPRGPGILKGNLEVGFDIVPVFLVLRGETAYGVQAALSFRHYLGPSSRIRPFVSLRSGPLVTTREVPENTSKFNFASSAGLGLVLPAKERLVYTVEVSFQHVSNANTYPHNPGMNSLQAQFGLSFFR